MANKTYHPRGKLVDGYKVRDHPLYNVWANMISRCESEKDVSYKNYGGRGIFVCERWRHFRFFAEDMGMKPTEEHTIERVDNDDGYYKENCRWATRSEQCVNRRKFSNNKTGGTGVKPCSLGRYKACFDYEKERYEIGRFDTVEEAEKARGEFIELFFKDKEKAIASISGETVWHNSKTNMRGITPHADGGFVARVTVAGVREYLGYFKTAEEAYNARQRRLKK